MRTLGRLIIASNRLPATVHVSGGGVQMRQSVGGLATGLAELLSTCESLWVGWHGYSGRLAEGQRRRMHADLRARHLEPVELTQDELRGYYDGVANGALWPLYHYQAERMPLELSGWDEYVAVNARFADVIAGLYRPGDTVWVHDYHLQLLPKLLRERVPSARIGFFLHIPFPSSEMFRILPWRTEILEGLLGADLVGFHTHAYSRHFQSALLRLLGVEAQGGAVMHEGRWVRIGAFPLGVNTAQIERQIETEAPSGESDVVDRLADLRRSGGLEHLMLAVDRLDYSKGIPRRLLAFERLLEIAPELRGRAALVQIAVPSRDNVPAYTRYRRKVEELVGRINGRFGLPGYQPIHYVSRGFTQGEVAALCRHADVMVVTPLRDGMNLVAKEFVAARVDLDGVLVLSEFAGAAAELGEAVQVNPYDVESTAVALLVAIQMPREEREARMKALRNRVMQFDASVWARKFIEFLHGQPEAATEVKYQRAHELAELVPTDRRIVLFLDYDGTLFPIVRIPQLAQPDKPLLALLQQLVKNPWVEIHVVSGRTHAVLDGWLGELGINLHAEHGAMSRMAGETGWTAVESRSSSDWQAFVKPVLAGLVGSVPGSFLEEKMHSLAWHYRMCDPEAGEKAANELRLHARETFAPMGLEVISGKRVVEVRPVGVNKGLIIERVLSRESADFLPIAIGDDATDDDMFHAMPSETGVTIGVGDLTAKPRYRLRDPAEVRRFLELLAVPGRLGGEARN